MDDKDNINENDTDNDYIKYSSHPGVVNGDRLALVLKPTALRLRAAAAAAALALADVKEVLTAPPPPRSETGVYILQIGLEICNRILHKCLELLPNLWLFCTEYICFGNKQH